ncbi:MAG: S8 family serine peptidase [Bacteroidota bacterium]
MKTLLKVTAFMFFFLFSLFLNGQTREIVFRGSTYEYSEAEDEYYLKSGMKKYHLVKDNIVVKLKNNLQMKDIQFSQNNLPLLEEVSSIGGSEYKLVKVPKGNNLLDIFIKLQNTDCFEIIEPNIYAKYLSTPNDNYYTNNYHWNLAKIDMPKAWDITTGSNTVKVAVIGGGADYNHEDLINQLNTTYKGWNYATNNENPIAYHYHETRCAGIIGATTNNSIGVSGIAGGWNGGGIKMMYYQCQPDAWSPPTSFNVGRAIEDAVFYGAKVISMSLGGLTYLSYLDDQITAAKNAGVVICVASGNYERYIDDRTGNWVYETADVEYPAENLDAISVGATTENDYRKTWDPDPLVEDWGSCYIGHLDIVAPGINISTTDLESLEGNKYTPSFLGTSAAAPHVAGVAALVFSLNNTDPTPKSATKS